MRARRLSRRNTYVCSSLLTHEKQRLLSDQSVTCAVNGQRCAGCKGSGGPDYCPLTPMPATRSDMPCSYWYTDVRTDYPVHSSSNVEAASWIVDPAPLASAASADFRRVDRAANLHNNYDGTSHNCLSNRNALLYHLQRRTARQQHQVSVCSNVRSSLSLTRKFLVSPRPQPPSDSVTSSSTIPRPDQPSQSNPASPSSSARSGPGSQVVQPGTTPSSGAPRTTAPQSAFTSVSTSVSLRAVQVTVTANGSTLVRTVSLRDEDSNDDIGSPL